MSMVRKKQRYAPVPLRALADKRLTPLELRLLSLIAAHDCFGAFGKGCTAGHKRLAEILGAAQKSVTRSIATLKELGYISVEHWDSDARKREYRIIYTLDDHAVIDRKRSEEENSDPTEPTPGDKQIGLDNSTQCETIQMPSVTETLQSVTIEPAIGNKETHSNSSKNALFHNPIEESKYKNKNTTHSIFGEAPNLSFIKHSDHSSLSNSQVAVIDFKSHADGMHAILEAWSEFKGWPVLLSEASKKHLLNSVERNGVHALLNTIARARASPFLRGERGDWGGMPIKWLWNEERIFEIKNGDYDERINNNTGRSSTGKVEVIRRLLDQSKNTG